MKRSLSVLLPIRNMQSSLGPLIHGLLEVLPELTADFEIVVVDDGSTDATVEVAEELVMTYPQVRSIRHREPLGRDAALETALKLSRGDVVFVHEPSHDAALNQIARLWNAVDEHPRVVGRTEVARWPNAWIGWKRRDGAGGLKMIQRHVLDETQESLAHQTALLRSLTQRGKRWHEVEMTRDASTQPASESTVREDKAAGPAPVGRMPWYLARLKDFALGE